MAASHPDQPHGCEPRGRLTPLFVRAAAVVLEVGGALQHGVVVAREFGKPCGVGIDRVTTRLHDGQRVEVDGTAGVIGLLP